MKLVVLVSVLFSSIVCNSQNPLTCESIRKLFNELSIGSNVGIIKDSLVSNAKVVENINYKKKHNDLEIYYYGKFLDSLWYGIPVENMEIRLMQNFKRKIVKGDTTTAIFNAFGYWFDYDIDDEVKIKREIDQIRLKISEQCGIQFQRESKKQKLIRAEVLTESYSTLIKNGVMPMIEINYEYSKDFKKGSVMIVYNF